MIEELFQLTQNIKSFHPKSISVIIPKEKCFDSKIKNIDFEQIFRE
jgi:hypothetical protein